MTDAEVFNLWRAHGENASALAPILGCNAGNARKRVQRAKQNLGILPSLISEPEDVDRANDNDLCEALERGNIPQDLLKDATLASLDVSTWGVAAKNADTQEIETKGMRALKARYTFKPTVAAWPPIAPAERPEIVTYYEPLPMKDEQFERVFIWGDTQIGFWLETDGTVTPFHDEAAIDVALQALARYRPNRVVIVGDFLDFPDLSRHQQHPEFARTMQLSLDCAYTLLLRIRGVVGKDCAISWIPGNHEKRLTLAVINNLGALYGIHRPGPQNFPLLSVPYLLHFDGLGIVSAGEYPSGEVWLSDDLVCTHAPPNGRNDIRANVIHGHEVRESVEARKIFFRDRATTFKTYCVPGLANYTNAANPYRACRTNVPSDRARINAQQAFATVEIADGMHKVTVWPIENGRAIFKDTILQARADEEPKAA